MRGGSPGDEGERVLSGDEEAGDVLDEAAEGEEAGDQREKGVDIAGDELVGGGGGCNRSGEDEREEGEGKEK